MNYQRDNEIARGIISGKIKELYCVKPPNQDHIIGEKYQVWCDKPYYNEEIAKIFIKSKFGIGVEIKRDTNISDFFETSIKKVRKNKLNKIKYGGY